jgi:hypothetical protein
MNKLDYKTRMSITQILNELNPAESLHPKWPDDYVYQMSILNEEAGEATQQANDCTFFFNKQAKEKFKKEVAQIGAMSLRILKNLD